MLKIFPRKISKDKKLEAQKNISNVLMMEKQEVENLKKEKKELLKDVNNIKDDRDKISIESKRAIDEFLKKCEENEKNNKHFVDISNSVVSIKDEKKKITKAFDKEKINIEKKRKELVGNFDKLESVLEFEIEKLEQELSSLNENIKNRSTELEELSNKIVVAQKVIEEKTQKKIDLDNDISVQERELKKLDNWIETKNFSNESYENKLKDLREQINIINVTKEEKEKELKKKDEELKLKKEELKKVKNQMLGMIKREERVNDLIPKIKKIAKKANLKINLE